MIILRYKQKLFIAGTGLICHMFVICTALLEQKHFDLLSLSPALRNLWLLLLCSSNFWVCGWNPMVLPFKWNLFSSTFTLCYLFLNILQMKQERTVEFWLWPLFALRKLTVSWTYVYDVFCHFKSGLFSILALPFGVTTETLATQDPEAEDEETETPIFEKHDAMLHGQRKDRK